MAKAAMAKKAPLEGVFDDVVGILRRYSPPFRTDVPCMSGGKKSFQLTVPKPVAVPGAYGGKPVDLQFAAVILQKDFVGFYLMCSYVNDAVKKNLAPGLLKLLKGKACFHIKTIDAALRKDIESALDVSEKAYRERGWL